MKKARMLIAALAVLFVHPLPVTTGMQAQSVVQYEPFELSFRGPSAGNPFVDVQISAEFKFASRTMRMDGFYDGGGVYKIRFMPDAAGEWSYSTKSNARELDGKSGAFACTKAPDGVHGPVRVRNSYHFGYADSTPFYPVGTTCYAWVWQGDALVRQTLATLRNSPFNKIRMCVFPKQYGTYIQNEPPIYPYEGSRKDGWNFEKFNPEYFRYFEQRVGELKDLGIEADIILFHPYDWGKWGFDKMPPGANDLYLKYAVARLAGFGMSGGRWPTNSI